MTESEVREAEAKLRALRELVASPGWHLLMEAAKEDILNACLAMADSPTMTEKEIDFRRGAISAARNFINVPERMVSILESSLYLASAEKQTHSDLNATA